MLIRILVPEDNGKQNPGNSYTNKYQKHVACSFGYELVYADDYFSKLFKTYLGEDSVYNFINSRIAESKYCKNISAKILWKLKKMLKILKTLLNVEFVIMFMLMVMLK